MSGTCPFRMPSKTPMKINEVARYGGRNNPLCLFIKTSKIPASALNAAAAPSGSEPLRASGWCTVTVQSSPACLPAEELGFPCEGGFPLHSAKEGGTRSPEHLAFAPVFPCHGQPGAAGGLGAVQFRWRGKEQIRTGRVMKQVAGVQGSGKLT